ncbi:restriction endonuclease subunit S [Helicobacter pylori]|uniref:restriction endonuclease subunit S n=1 Tax=Helicobacter pylori TaxID=210 RepID=UPI00165C017A|nr:restriction endonuclease subunit S [Helicobacter pylori]
MDALTTPLNWQRVRLGDILTLKHGRDYKNFKLGNIPVYGSGGYMLSINNFLHNGESVCIGRKGTIDKPIYLNGKFWVVDTLFYSYSFKKSIPKFIFYAFSIIKWSNYNEATGVPSLTKMTISNIEIPLPPLDEQIAIANILSGLDHYLYSLDALILKKEGVKKALRIKMLNQILASNGVEFKKIGEICLIKRGRVIAKKILQENGKYPVYSSQTLNNGILGFIDTYDFDGEFLTWTTDGAYAGSVFYRNGRFSITNVCGLLQVIQDNIIHKYLYYILQITAPLHVNPGMGNPKLMSAAMQQIKIPLPPLNEQIAIANVLSALDNEIISLKNKKRQFENIKKALNHDLMSAKIRVLKE